MSLRWSGDGREEGFSELIDSAKRKVVKIDEFANTGM